jgi:hypothetical protein
MIRGAVAIGITPETAMQLVVRCARDSIPPLRLEIPLDVAANPDTKPGDVRKRVNRPWRTVKREMESLYMLRLLSCIETEETRNEKVHRDWHYRLADDSDEIVLRKMMDRT